MSGERRRGHDPPEPERRRREDRLEEYAGQLEELLEHGSRNFRRYRRRAYAGFALLAATNAVALYGVNEQRSALPVRIAEASADVQEESCRAGNRLRGELRDFLSDLELDDQTERLARGRFRDRACAEAVEPLRDAAREG